MKRMRISESESASIEPRAPVERRRGDGLPEVSPRAQVAIAPKRLADEVETAGVGATGSSIADRPDARGALDARGIRLPTGARAHRVVHDRRELSCDALATVLIEPGVIRAV